MKHDRFNLFFVEFVAEMKSLGYSKGGEYAHGDDRLDNFKRNAEALNLTAFDVWAIYAAKHWDAINTFVMDQRTFTQRPRSESIRGRALDLALYMILFAALVEDESAPPEDPVLKLVWEENHK